MAAIDRLDRVVESARMVSGLLDVAADWRCAGQDSVLASLIAAVERLDFELAASLKQRFESLPPVPEDVPDRVTRYWEDELENCRLEIIRRPGKLLQRAVAFGINDLAFDLLQEVLSFHPDNLALRRTLGQHKVAGRWISEFAYQKAREGLFWHDELGWVVADQGNRYAAGEYYDLQNEQWTTVEQANAAHASIDNWWFFETDHLSIRGTCDIKTLVNVANRLEAFHARIFAAYAAFFSDDERDYRLVLGMAEQPRLSVYVLRDHEDYSSLLPQAASWSSGSFYPARRASYFVGASQEVMYHEFCHHILHEFTGCNESPAWLTEGIAVYSESPHFDAYGDLVLGGLERNKRIQSYLAAFRQGSHMPAADVMQIVEPRPWKSVENPHPQYAAAGSLVHFCMEAEQRKHREDFIDFLYDSYRGTTGGYQIWDYLGHTRASLLDSFEAWLHVEADRLASRK